VSHDKVFVCKYVSTPGGGERLQTGNNPIDVSQASIKPFGGIGSSFADAQGRSVVLAYAGKGVPKPPITDCPAPQGHEPIVTTSVVYSTTCELFTTTTTTTTTPFVLVDGEWVHGTPVVTTGTVTSTPTAKQLSDATLVCPPEQPTQPDPTVTTTVATNTTCALFTTTTTTTTTPFVWNGGAWVLGSPVVTAATVTSKPTPKQITDRKLVCAQPPPPHVVVVTEKSGGAQVTAAKPVVKVHAASVVTETSDAVQIAATHPLPSAARAGDADTSGQLVAGGLAGIGALLAMGAGFVLRRREGEV